MIQFCLKNICYVWTLRNGSLKGKFVGFPPFLLTKKENHLEEMLQIFDSSLLIHIFYKTNIHELILQGKSKDKNQIFIGLCGSGFILVTTNLVIVKLTQKIFSKHIIIYYLVLFPTNFRFARNKMTDCRAYIKYILSSHQRFI